MNEENQPSSQPQASNMREEEELTIADYEEVLESQRKLVCTLDVMMNGEDGAAKQASLCDIVAQFQQWKEQLKKDYFNTGLMAERIIKNSDLAKKDNRIKELQNRLTEVIQDYHDAEQKVEFYRKETSKLRQYLNDNKIGKPNQGLFDALYDHIATLTSQLSEEKEKHGQTWDAAVKDYEWQQYWLSRKGEKPPDKDTYLKQLGDKQV